MDQSLVQNGYVLTQVEGDTVADCLTMLTTALPREVTFLHIRGLYFSESFARSGQLFQALTAPATAKAHQAWGHGVPLPGQGEDVLKAQTPFLGRGYSKPRIPASRSCSHLRRTDALLVEVYNRLLGKARMRWPCWRRSTTATPWKPPLAAASSRRLPGGGAALQQHQPGELFRLGGVSGGAARAVPNRI